MAAVSTGTPGSPPHSLQLPSYIATEQPGAAWSSASTSRQAVVPLPHEATSGREASTPAAANTARSCSGDLSLNEFSGVGG